LLKTKTKLNLGIDITYYFCLSPSSYSRIIYKTILHRLRCSQLFEWILVKPFRGENGGKQKTIVVLLEAKLIGHILGNIITTRTHIILNKQRLLTQLFKFMVHFLAHPADRFYPYGLWYQVCSPKICCSDLGVFVKGNYSDVRKEIVNDIPENDS